MKIDEIFGSETPIRVGNHTKQQWRSSQHRARLGSGSFGFARDNPIDPHLVAKRNFAAGALERDAYYTYIKYTVDHNMAEDNIHVPRVYSIQLLPTVTTDANKNFPQTHFYRIDIEKLVQGHTLNPEEMKAAIDHLVNPDIIEGLKDWHYDAERYMQFAIIEPIRQYLKGNAEYIIDEKLKEVLDVVIKLKHTAEPNLKFDLFSFDTHTGNYMFRRTSVGCQLVVTDPLC